MISRHLVATSLALSLGASGALVATSTVGTAVAASTPQCSPKALSSTKGPVTITYWQSMPRANGEVMKQLTDQFNASQSKVHVNLVVQTTYEETFQKFKAGLSNGQLPDVAMLTDTDTQAAIDTQAFIPSQTCMKAAGYKTGDLLSRALAYWRVNKTQWAMPFGVSGPVLYYNKKAFAQAGLNPDHGPATLAEMVKDAKILKNKGVGGAALVLDPWHFQTWLATSNHLFAGTNNGRTGRATKVAFRNDAGLAIFAALNQMKSDGSVETNAVQGAGRYDNLLGAGSGKYSMTIDTSAALGTIQQLLATGQYPNVDVGVSPFPKLSAKSRGGVEPAGNALWISKKSTSAKQAAAWQYIAYLDSTASQVTWSAGTGYIPLRTSAAKSSTIQDLWAKNPGFKVAYTQLTQGVQSYATAGAVVGPFADVNTAVANAETSMFVKKTTPRTALAGAQSAADRVISKYDQRLGVR